MKLNDDEMKLKDLEYSPLYGAGIIGEVVIFALNNNISNPQREILTKEIISRCNTQPDLLAACEYLLCVIMRDEPKGGSISNEAVELTKSAISRAKKE